MYLFPSQNLEDNISRFLKYFSDKMELIHPADQKYMDKLFVKILSVGLLDALSKTTTPNNMRNRERLVTFLRNFSGWNNCDKISLPHLIKYLDTVPSPEYSEVREYAFSMIDKWEPGIFTSINNDIDFNEVRCRWPKNINKNNEVISLGYLQHVHLFYSFRNGLMHELREIGYGMEIGMDDEPYYHTMKDGDVHTWELVYPVSFYKKICENVIGNLRDYYIKNRINPYNYYNFGTYWVEALN